MAQKFITLVLLSLVSLSCIRCYPADEQIRRLTPPGQPTGSLVTNNGPPTAALNQETLKPESSYGYGYAYPYYGYYYPRYYAYGYGYPYYSYYSHYWGWPYYR